jgi:biopolymer transport protein ExbD
VIDFEPRRRVAPDIDLTPLIDISFILVIFIVLAATFSRVKAIDVELPGVATQTEPRREALVVTIPQEGALRFGDELVQPDDAPAALVRLRAQHDSVLLLADRQAAVERAVQLLAQAQAAGYPSVAIATQPPGDASR